MDCSIPEWERFLPHSSGERLHHQSVVAFAGQGVLVTGAGGSIGSALVKTIASAGPRSLVLLDSSEHNLFEIQRYLEKAYPAVSCQAILGSVDDTALLEDTFSRFPPDIIFHAAAFKHVALLERNLFSAVRNNVLGTYTLAKAALQHGISKLVLVSTDKAVHPHSVMGVSKRIAELITVALSGPAYRMNVIRLGNVIGSSGSVVPIFLDQIEKGQPITVTDPEASRYFLSREEAVKAILAAGTAECEACILLPKLREPVRIAELARILASLSANDRGRTTPICFTGLRPGEKLNEDLIAAHETQIGTTDHLLTIIKTQRLSATEADEVVERLATCIANRDAARLLELLSSLVPEYCPSRLVLEDVALAPQRYIE